VRGAANLKTMLWSWSEKFPLNGENASLPSRQGHSSFVFNNAQLVILGGTRKSRFMNDMLVCDLENSCARWKKKVASGAVPSPRAYSSFAQFDPYTFLMFGGQTGEHELASDLRMLKVNPDGRLVWILLKVSGVTPSARYGHAVGCYRNMFIIHGGRGRLKSLRDVGVLDMTSRTWLDVQDIDRPAPRYLHSGSIVGRYLIIFGGRNARGKVFNDVHALDLETWRWYKPSVQGAIPEPRYGHSCVVIGYDIVMTGGRLASGKLASPSSVYVLDARTWEWSHRECLRGSMPNPRAFHSLSFARNSLFLVGGETNTPYDTPTNTLHQLDIISECSIRNEL
jgi:hypothetical protein